MSEYNRGASEPVTVRERVAYAMAAYDMHSGDYHPRLLDEELEQLAGLMLFVYSPTAKIYKHGTRREGCPPHACLETLLRLERQARKLEPKSGSLFVSWRDGALEQSWQDYLPMADAVLTTLSVFPDIVRAIRADAQANKGEDENAPPIIQTPLFQEATDA